MKRFFLFLAIILSVTGCFIFRQRKENIEVTERSFFSESKVMESLSMMERKEEALSEKNTGKVSAETSREDSGGVTEESKADLLQSQRNKHAFQMLSANEQEIYLEIFYALENKKQEIELSIHLPEYIDKVFQCVLIDHPEIFYTDGYSFVKYTLGEEVMRITFRPNYLYDREEIEERTVRLEEETDKFLNKVPGDISNYEKVKLVYEFVITNTEYSKQAIDNQNICSVFLGKASVCQGYAKAVQYLLEQMGVFSTLVMGSVETGEGHAWNIVKIDEQYYHVDATWGDASYFYNQEEVDMQYQPTINYDYLCIPTKEIARTHFMDPVVPVPECTSFESNYYVMEGAFFTEFDEEQLADLIKKTRESEKESFTIKASDDSVYSEMIEILLEGQSIFSYLETESSSIVYADSKEQRTLTFWLDS